MNSFLGFIGDHVFHAFALLALLGAAAMIFARNVVHSVIGFLVAMLSTAACYLVLQAEFLAMAQVLVYAGGIVVLFLFVVMLVEMDKHAEKGRFQTQLPLAVGATLTGAAAALAAFWQVIFRPAAEVPLRLSGALGQGIDPAVQNAEAVSRGLYSGYLLPFEILSVILMVALVGAVTLAKSER